MTDRPTDQENILLGAHWYRESSPKISAIYLKYQHRKLYFSKTVKDELTDRLIVLQSSFATKNKELWINYGSLTNIYL